MKNKLNVNSKESVSLNSKQIKVKYIAVSFWTVQNYKNQKHFENFKKSYGKNLSTWQQTDVQNHPYTNKSRRTYVRDVHQFLNLEYKKRSNLQSYNKTET